jgi:hypothetical protein
MSNVPMTPMIVGDKNRSGAGVLERMGRGVSRQSTTSTFLSLFIHAFLAIIFLVNYST